MNAVNQPKVSVIIPNYNHAPYLRQRIETVLRQTFQDFEVILMDDCSTDESGSIISEYASDPRVRIERNEKNSGSTFKQWNKGVQLSRGKYIWLAESDDYADERLLELLVPALESEPAAKFAYCRSWWVDEEGRQRGFIDLGLSEAEPQRWAANYCSDGRDECRNYFVVCNTVPNASAVLFRKTAYAEVGGADESFRICGDWKLWAGMALKGKVVYVAQPLNYFRVHDDSVRSRDIGRGIVTQETLRVVRWILGHVKVTDSTLARVREKVSELWIPALITLTVPLGVKFTILSNATAIEPWAFRRMIRPAFIGFGLKLQILRRLSHERRLKKKIPANDH